MMAKVAIATTNEKDFKDIKSLKHPAALERRMHVWLEMRPKKEYQVPSNDGVWFYTLDPAQKKGSYFMDWDLYEFEDKNTGKIYNTQREILELIRDAYQKNERTYETMVIESNQMCKIAAELRAKPQMNSLETLDMSDNESELTEMEPEQYMSPNIITADLIGKLNVGVKKFKALTKRMYVRFKEFFLPRARRFILALWDNFNFFDTMYLALAVYACTKVYGYFFPDKEKQHSLEEFGVKIDATTIG